MNRFGLKFKTVDFGPKNELFPQFDHNMNLKSIIQVNHFKVLLKEAISEKPNEKTRSEVQKVMIVGPKLPSPPHFGHNTLILKPFLMPAFRRNLKKI